MTCSPLSYFCFVDPSCVSTVAHWASQLTLTDDNVPLSSHTSTLSLSFSLFLALYNSLPPYFAVDDDWDSEDEGDGGDHLQSHMDTSFVRAVAMYDFVPVGEGQLALNAGDVIEVTHRDPENGWWTGSCGHSSGVFPASYVRAFTGSSRKLAKAIYPYTAQNAGELSFEADTLISIVAWNDDWAVGVVDGVEGPFPTTYVDRQFVHNTTYSTIQPQSSA
eukprot:m.26275 g.26275  ORF g.26275 m.26275 type:complete len:219 (-) comp8809_c1_seq1:1309-1965(-)